jgi:hypothetical protein
VKSRLHLRCCATNVNDFLLANTTTRPCSKATAKLVYEDRKLLINFEGNPDG